MFLMTNAIRDDIASQREVFDVFEVASGQPGVLSHARLLDILAWYSKGDAPAREPGEIHGD